MSIIDTFTERASRGVARRTSRRSFLTRFGTVLVGAAAIPVLPVARSTLAQDAAQDPNGAVSQDPGDPRDCDYWRYCALGGYLCSCCGGSATTCPPGSEMSPIAWVGTCANPADGRNYIISYNDCCGAPTCNNCACNNNEGEKPAYRPHLNNGILWCLGIEKQTYTCTTAIVLGVALEEAT